MFNFVADIGCCQVVEETLEVIPNLDLVFIFSSVLAFDEILIDILHQEGFNEGCVFFLLVVPCRFSRINKDWWR